MPPIATIGLDLACVAQQGSPRLVTSSVPTWRYPVSLVAFRKQDRRQCSPPAAPRPRAPDPTNVSKGRSSRRPPRMLPRRRRIEIVLAQCTPSAADSRAMSARSFTMTTAPTGRARDDHRPAHRQKRAAWRLFASNLDEAGAAGQVRLGQRGHVQPDRRGNLVVDMALSGERIRPPRRGSSFLARRREALHEFGADAAGEEIGIVAGSAGASGSSS